MILSYAESAGANAETNAEAKHEANTIHGMMEHTLISSEDETSAEANAYGMIKHNNRLALETKLHKIEANAGGMMEQTPTRGPRLVLK